MMASFGNIETLGEIQTLGEIGESGDAQFGDVQFLGDARFLGKRQNRRFLSTIEHTLVHVWFGQYGCKQKRTTAVLLP